jgi:hypothetical protein
MGANASRWQHSKRQPFQRAEGVGHARAEIDIDFLDPRPNECFFNGSTAIKPVNDKMNIRLEREIVPSLRVPSPPMVNEGGWDFPVTANEPIILSSGKPHQGLSQWFSSLRTVEVPGEERHSRKGSFPVVWRSLS